MIEGDEDVDVDVEICEGCGNTIDECICEEACCGGCISEATDYVRSAINSLSACTRKNPEVKDSLANLSVVLFELNLLNTEEEAIEEAVEDTIEEAIEDSIEEEDTSIL